MANSKAKLAAAVVVTIAAAAAIVFWRGTSAPVALADVLARMDRIDAYTCEAIITLTSPADRRVKSTTWISRGYGTKTVTRDANSGEVASETYVLPEEKTAILIQHDKKAYMRLSFDDQWADEIRREIPDPRQMLVRIQKCDHTSLGLSTVDGVEAEGFRTTDPNYMEDGAARVDVSLWVDVATGLPVRSEEDIELKDGMTLRRVSHDFQWDTPIDPLLFQPLIPDGYADAGGGSIQIPAFNEETAIKGLKFCLELAGRYPTALSEPGLKPYAEYLPELRGLTKEQVRAYVQDPNHRGQIMQKTLPLMGLWVFHGMLGEQKREPAYYGDTVTPDSPHAVLLRWKLDDGRYRAIFGDLSARDVSADELAALEAVPPNDQPHAVSPQPADRSVGCSLTGLHLQWRSGVATVEHRIYFGQSPDSLSPVATVTEPNYPVPDTLQREASYYWRVDEVRADGAVTPGPVWQFNTGRLIAHWQFDDASGEQVTDASGHAYHGQIQGNPVWTEGVTGGALQLDGDGDYVEIGPGEEFNITGQITVAAWFKVTAFDKDSQAIVTKGDKTWRLQRNRGTHSLLFACFGLKTADEWGATRGRTKVDDGRWHHAAGVYDGERIALYIDGKLDASAPASGSIAAGDEPVLIGNNSEELSRAWHGLLDDVRLYTYALSEAEIVTLYGVTSPNGVMKLPR